MEGRSGRGVGGATTSATSNGSGATSNGGKRKYLEDDSLEVMPIGAGNEVGRSCIIVKYKGKTVMVRSTFLLSFSIVQLDCGIHPAYSGISALPYFDMIDPSTIDLLLVSQYTLLSSTLFYS